MNMITSHCTRTFYLKRNSLLSSHLHESSDSYMHESSHHPYHPISPQAIRPAELDGTFKTPAQTGLDGSKKLLYSLIYRRTLASVMKPSQALTKTYTINAQNEGNEKGKEKGKGGKSNDDHDLHSAVFRASETVSSMTNCRCPLPF